MWRAIMALIMAWQVAALRTGGIDVPMMTYLEYRHLRRLLREQLDECGRSLASKIATAQRDDCAPSPALPAVGSTGRQPSYLLVSAFLFAGLFVAVAIMFVGRWEIVSVGGQPYRLDRWTGTLAGCNAPNAKRLAAFELGTGVIYRCGEFRGFETKGVLPKLGTMTREEAEQFLGPEPMQ